MRSCLLAIEWIPQASCPEKKLLRAGGVDGGASTGTALKIHAPALDRRWGPSRCRRPDDVIDTCEWEERQLSQLPGITPSWLGNHQHRLGQDVLTPKV